MTPIEQLEYILLQLGHLECQINRDLEHITEPIQLLIEHLKEEQ